MEFDLLQVSGKIHCAQKPTRGQIRETSVIDDGVKVAFEVRKIEVYKEEKWTIPLEGFIGGTT